MMLEFSGDILSESLSDIYSYYDGLGVLSAMSVIRIMVTGGSVDKIEDPLYAIRILQTNLRAGLSLEETVNMYKNYVFR